MLNDMLTPRQLCDWWVMYQLEPWGEFRSDLREGASLMLAAGVDGATVNWPYLDQPPTADEIRQQMANLEHQINGHSSKNRNSA